MGDNITVTAGRDSNIATGNSTLTVNTGSGAPDELITKLQELEKAVETLAAQLTPDQAEEIQEDLDRFVADATKEKPKRKWYSVTGQGLIDAVKAVGALGTPVTKSVQSVVKLLDQTTGV